MSVSVTDKVTPEKVASAESVRRASRKNTKKGYLICKRIFDIAVSVIAILILLVPMAIVALLIVIEDPGPVFYSQERLGKHGKPFQIHKFRSMCVNAEKDGPQWAHTEDPRCTRVGKVIRRWHIDELPQLWNVVKGEMSIVGPRPEREHFYQVFEQELPNYRERLLVDQGLTCIGQVNGCYDLTPAKRIDYDIDYIEKQSFWMDMKCIFQTFAVICNHKGAR